VAGDLPPWRVDRRPVPLRAPPELAELAALHRHHLRWLRRKAPPLLQQRLDMLAAAAEEARGWVAPPERPFVTLGRSPGAFVPYTAVIPYGPLSDPINLVFHGDAPARRVAGLLRGADPRWQPATRVPWLPWLFPPCSSPQWVTFGAPRAADPVERRAAGHSLSPEGCALDRTHVRLWDGGEDPEEGGWGRWSLGSAHIEVARLEAGGHMVVDWEGAERSVVEALGRAGRAPVQVAPLRLQPDGELCRGVAHDGVAAAVRLG